MIEMVNSFISSFFQIFAGTTFGLMFLGVVVGFAVGILPGLGGPTTLAIMLPFVVKMSPVDAFAFLLGMAAVTNTTGDITSILVGVPGEPTTAATIIDGHPMAKKGEAGRALAAVLLSSLVGAIFGAFGLAAAIPIVRPLVLSFGSPEFFMLALLGITFVASLSGRVLLRGMIAAGIGLFLATVGVAPISGVQRYTFGQTFLWDGIGLVPITIGFFAIPEVIDLAVRGSSIAGDRVSNVGGIMEGVKDTFRHFWLVIRASAIGTYAAIIPGMGPGTTQWLAYAHAVQSSRDKERFGKGAIEGVLAPGAANNSSLGGSLITTVAFGVPASVTMAILLGAFLIQGIVPGPDMLLPEPRGHLGLTFSFVWINVFSNIITVAICFLFLNQLVKVTQIRASLLIPLIIFLIYLGAFAEKNAFADLILVLFFGVIGWVLERVRWPRPPLILGVVLGPLAENRLFLSIETSGLEWLWRPWVIVLIIVILAGAIYPIFQRWSNRRRLQRAAPVSQILARKKSDLPRFTWETIVCIFIIVALVLALWESRDFDFMTGFFPWVIGFALLSITFVWLLLGFMGKQGVSGEEEAEEGPQLSADIVNRRTLDVFVWLFGYFLAIWLLGFSIGVPLCTVLQLKVTYREKWLLTVLITFIVWIFIFFIFDRVLHVPFPTGQLLLWLGLLR